MKKPKIAIVIIHYNTPQFLQTCLDSIFKQTYQNIEVFFIDNDSPSDVGIELVKEKYGHHKNLKIIGNEHNSGYSGAANQGMKLAIEHKNPADYVVITNPDIIYSPTYFEKVVHRMEKDPEIAAITGKVYKYDFEKKEPTKIIDTVGLIAYKNRRIADDGQGLEDHGQFDKECEIFGVSGACPMYRREALEAVKIEDEYLDDDFFMYKEDVDLSWRFQLFGYKCLYYPKAVAFHGRGTGIHRRFTKWEILFNRNRLSEFQKFYSFKNQLLMQLKNELPGNFFRNLPHILATKLLTPFYLTFREPHLWKAYIAYLKQAPKMLKKRKIIMEKKKATAKDMQKWFVGKSKYLS
ncbi:hypothetical protein COU74_04915 [Candidatus Peregrinibacteria bacterium CG10_big_fil_rev_8_21_14_0_10_36_19]|nr:MAG: hypothetical protein COU74_04915 [Candidatus Peregrinibacteria bacterium CG10_big_fil_rev_8_21_14_0_10_36_19]